MVERIPKSLFRTYSPVAIYLDDLETITEVLSIDSEGVIELWCGDFIYKSLSELKDHKNQKCLNEELLIVLRNKEFALRTVSITLGPESLPRFSSDEDNEKTRSFMSHLEDILSKRRIFNFDVLKNVNPNILMTMGVLTSIFVFFILASIYSIGLGHSIVYSVFSFFLSMIIFAVLHEVKRPSRIYLIRLSEKETFFSRNKDQILLLIVGAIVGSGFTVLLTYIISFLSSK